MKKIIFLLLLLVLVTGGLFFYGNPIERAESKDIAIKYLQKKHPEQSVKISSVSYYPGEGTYIVNYSINKGEQEGNLDIRKGKVIEIGNE
ncbi:hypothetical protein AM500_09780 [Bacillus sp. FJAT-18017]|uniref:YfjL-like protein n=1 Tax=Bacillus sp. FJAT-18017 TaxID=1705566 RepID=UPI0006B01E78|nr:hypothetical protein [Bacillus sp. FJAT-18017]ALC90037.1 hypothetical protein AM500_09780 [Bacillus sp. FJAT-18017]